MMSFMINSSTRRAAFLGGLLAALSAGQSFAENPPRPSMEDALATDPVRMGWMVGAPPKPDRIIRFADGSYFKFPAWRWTVTHFRQLMPTVNVSRGLEAPSSLPRALREDLDEVSFLPLGSDKPMTWSDSLLANYTDGIIVLHRGKVVYERYFGVLDAEGEHGAMSITKTFVGTLAAALIAEGTLDADKTVEHYLPELADSGFAGATVRQVMDMTTGVRFTEDYADPNADIWRHGAAGNPLPKPDDYKGPRNFFEFLQTVKPQGRHGEAFHYRTINTDVLGWILSRVTGRNVAELLSENIWKKMGAEQDAYMTVDSIGTPFAGGGLNLGLRDLARFGEMIRNDGRYDGVQVVPKKAVERIRAGGDPSLFAKADYPLLQGWSYGSMWWHSHNPHDAFMARGVFGQSLYIDPTAEMVIARFASHPTAGNAAIDPTTLPAYHALARYLMADMK